MVLSDLVKRYVRNLAFGISVAAGSLYGRDALADSDFKPSGLQIQARMGGDIVTQTATSPGFTLAHRNDNLALGVGLGFRAFSGKVEDEKVSGNMFQLNPIIYYDIGRSEDGLARMNLVGSIGYGRGSIDADGDDGTVTFLPVLAGLGGDYFLHPNFALGVEAGINIIFLTGVEADGEKVDASFSTQLLYGLVRYTFISGSSSGNSSPSAAYSAPESPVGYRRERLSPSGRSSRQSRDPEQPPFDTVRREESDSTPYESKSTATCETACRNIIDVCCNDEKFNCSGRTYYTCLESCVSDAWSQEKMDCWTNSCDNGCKTMK